MDDATAVWVAACERMRALGHRVAVDAGGGDGDRAEGVAHLVGQLIGWMEWSVFHADPLRPSFQRQNDVVMQWGGPSADFAYRHAPVEPGRRYRITGRMHACEEFVLAVRKGFMHQPTWGTVFEVTATDLGLGPGDDIDVLVGEGGPVPLPDGAAMVSIRELYLHWQDAEPATMIIECLDGEANTPAPRLTSAEMAVRLDHALAAAEHSLGYWADYLREHRRAHRDNSFAPIFAQAKGLDAARYGFCFWDLGPDDALVVETPVPDARYWSFQLYDVPWFRRVDCTDRQSSLNQTQLASDDDGRVRVVVSHRDPGVANWLDTGGRAEGLLMIRCFWASDLPAPATTVVPFAEVPSRLPRDTQRIGAAARAGVLAARRRHLAWRFRA